MILSTLVTSQLHFEMCVGLYGHPVFNKCMVKGVYPNSLKIAQVIPVHKKGDKSACSNYKPISLLSQFHKIFERILHQRLY